MTWKAYEPPVAAGQLKNAPITLAVTVGPRFKPRVRISVRPELLDDVKWWKKGALVSLLIGEGEDAGSIRITKDGPFPLSDGTLGSGRFLLNVPLWPGAAINAIKKVAPEFDYGDSWIEITLPASMLTQGTPTETTAAKPPGPTAAASPLITDKKGAPFRGLGSTGPDPHPMMQRPATRATPR